MNNIEVFAQELSHITGQVITPNHIHPMETGRYSYTQAPKEETPILLHHYRGPFCVDIHPQDLKMIELGEISITNYIENANWMVGYYWGGPSMISGGYYQPMKLVDNPQLKRYLQLLKCRGYLNSGGHWPTQNDCQKCKLKNCPISKYKCGESWENEVQENDPRIDFYRAIRNRVNKIYPQFIINGFHCLEIEDDVVLLCPNYRYTTKEPYTFSILVSENIIRKLLTHEVTPDDWDSYVTSFSIFLTKPFEFNKLEITNQNIKKIFSGVNIYEKTNQQHTNTFKARFKRFIDRVFNR